MCRACACVLDFMSLFTYECISVHANLGIVTGRKY